MKRILSTLLVAVMLFGAIVGLIPMPTVHVYALEGEDEGYLTATNNAVTKSYASLEDKLKNDKSMKLRLAVTAENGDVYKLYANQYTGEVIYYNETTKEAVTTNPYDVCGMENLIDPKLSKLKISDSIKERLMSQVVVSYKGKDGASKTMYSFTDAAKSGQISIKPIANGIRVQYTIGRENSVYLMPAWITVDRFEEEILKPFNERVEEIKLALDEALLLDPDAFDPATQDLQKAYDDICFKRDRVTGEGAIYSIFDPNEFVDAPEGSVEHDLLLDMQKNYPITAKPDPNNEGKLYAIYTVADDLVSAQKKTIESLIRTYCPEYTYEDLEADNALTGYVSKEETPPLFKLSLEYTINKNDGSLDIRLPANSILYDETLYQLESISTLNYMGAGRMSESTYGSYFGDFTNTVWDDLSDNGGFANKKYTGEAADKYLMDGYLFYPDGSGAIFEFSDLYTVTNKPNVFWSGKIYGQDYAYYTVTGKNQEAIRLPVYGVVSTSSVTPVANSGGGYDLKTKKSGFLAILEEGEAMTNLAVSFGATAHNYASVYPVYYPRPKDTYDLADSISVSGNTEWTVVADRKYTGSYRTRVVMLSDEPTSKTPDYTPSWVGMAKAYQNYLKATEVLNPITAEEIREQIPLYIEAFGAYETTKQILSMPVDVKVPLTSFEDVQTIYRDLSENAGIYNINFKLTGFANGGMLSRYPAKLKWEKSVGGKDGFRDLIALAEEKGFGVYPDFDFTYISNQAAFDGVSLKGLGARTVDNRYCSKQIYDAVYQQFMSYFDMCVSTNLIAKYYDKFSDKLMSYAEDGSFGLSVGTLGSDLNSNFDEDNPINREEAKEDIVNLLASMKESYKTLMINSGNSYALGYADHILSMPLSSSNFRYASASVPFMAMVLHGYVNYTGSPINMAGDTAFNLLKLIENGAYPYFQLSYNTENTMLLKKDEVLSKYYSIRYDIWRWDDPDAATGKGEIVTQYERLNKDLADLQRAEMVDHQFIIGERSLKPSEIAANKQALHQTVLAAVEAEIKNREADFFRMLSGTLTLHATISDHDAKILSSMNSVAEQSNAVSTYLASNSSGLRGLSDPHKEMILNAYTTGNGFADISGEISLNTLVAPHDTRIKSAIDSEAQDLIRAAVTAYFASVSAPEILTANTRSIADAYKNGTQDSLADEIKTALVPYDADLRAQVLSIKQQQLDTYFGNRGLAGLTDAQRGEVKDAYLAGSGLADVDSAMMVDLSVLLVPHDAKIIAARDAAHEGKAAVLAYLKSNTALSLSDTECAAILSAYADGNGLADLATDLRAKVEDFDHEIEAALVAGRREGVLSYLKRQADLSTFSTYFDKVADAYAAGDGLADLKVLRTLDVEIDSDFEQLWKAVLDGMQGNKVLDEDELQKLKDDVKAILEQKTNTTATSLYAKLQNILGVAPTAEDIELFNLLIYSGADSTRVKARAASSFSVKITDTAKLDAMAALVETSRTNKTMLVLVSSVEFDYDFNTTDSSATDGKDYVGTDYTLQDERLVLVVYRKPDGEEVKIVLNYNIFDVKVKLDGETEPREIKSYDWLRISN